MSENKETFINLASRIESVSLSRFQILKEWLASFFWVNQVDDNLLDTLSHVSRSVDDIIWESPTQK